MKSISLRLADLRKNLPRRITIDGKPVAVVRTDEGVFAVSDVCSHAEVSLSEGEVSGCAIVCWLHGSRFDLRTGEPTGLPATEPVPVYPVEVRDGEIYLPVGDDGRPKPSNGVIR